MTPKLIQGIEQIADTYDHFIIDVWGVLHDGRNAYPGAADALRTLKAAGKQVLLLSNSPNRATRVIEKVLGPIGIGPDLYDHILTSGEAAHAHMRDHHAGQKVYTFWDEEESTAIDNAGLERVFEIDAADFIYGSLVPYDAIAVDYDAVLARARARDLPMVCGNPDRIVGYGATLHLCVGALAERYENAGGTVTWIGKPYRPIYDQARAMLGNPDKSRILAIGDGLLTDIAGAANFGCDVVWNVIGIHWDEVSTKGTIDAAKVERALAGRPAPSALMHGFKP
ncbi:MAG: TIGR01459 family HAD-type hydrolase [Rhodospirillales bacterium]|nr:TIGR01459 family HAD-type hydrolase [Alphaproteobacteria bacterium]MCB9987095.1 TIGR01459 family HAD-type hydrolase [Rhodospirillales bacterium]USO08145.1 MAG: TIGR01459 family HAD-type hydrolase [Rhodospirillales bacterium]